MGDVVKFSKRRRRKKKPAPEAEVVIEVCEWCCPHCGCDMFRWIGSYLYCAACSEEMAVMVVEDTDSA